MIKRIRYELGADGCYLSTRVIPTDRGEVMVRYHKDTKVVHIFLAADASRVLETFVSKSDFQMKRDIKAKLINLGAKFAPETRKKNAEQDPQ